MESQLRLLFIANPNSTHTRRWVSWFDQRGHTVSIIADTPLVGGWETGEIFDLASRFNVRVLRYPFWELQTRKIIRRWQPDILHAHRVSSAGWLGAFSGFHPLVVTPWGSDLYQQPARSALASRLARFTLPRADVVTADSQDLCSLAVRFGANQEATKMIQWGVDTSVFFPAARSLDWQNRLHIHGKPVILSPRGVNRIYNLDIIIQALAQVRLAYPEIILILREYNVDPGYKLELEQLIDSSGLRANIRWIKQIEPYAQLVELYRLADIVVSIASSDGTPVSVLEAMACGIPVIAGDLPSLREWINNKDNGLLVPLRDPDRLAGLMINLLENSATRNLFAARGRALIAEKAEHGIEMTKMEHLYWGLAG